MVKVEVALFADLRRFYPNGRDSGPMQLEVPDGTTIDGLLGILGIPAALTKLCYVDHTRREGDHVLSGGERVAIFSPIAGG